MKADYNEALAIARSVVDAVITAGQVHGFAPASASLGLAMAKNMFDDLSKQVDTLADQARNAQWN